MFARSPSSPQHPPASLRARRQFPVVLIKPSHYDDDGYVIRWWRSTMPSNSLASVYALTLDAGARRVLGPDIDIAVTAIDETNTRVRIGDIIAQYRSCGGAGLVGLIGVQSNQYPRALDIARRLRAAGIPVVIGGFHVSGVLAMLPGIQPELQAALDLGVSLFAGEAEGRMDQVLCDAAADRLRPIYNFVDDLPALQGAMTPFLPRAFVRRTVGTMTSFDAGRGCPFQCSFCTIINVQGRKSRRRSPDDVEQIIRRNWDQGVARFFITDDNFARNKDWEPIFDRIIELRERDGMDVRFMIQVDTMCHRIPDFVAKAKRAGVTRIFIGLENINPDNLLAAKKRQNKITEYRKMLLAWKAAGIFTYAGYIIGFPNDTPESVRRDIEIIKRELPLDILEFFLLTPLPGSEDHKTLWSKSVGMDADLNRYDLEHVVTAHPRMTRSEWERIGAEAWALYYTPEHIETVMRRGRACGINIFSLMIILLWFSSSFPVENVHPLQGGILRLKSRYERRPELGIEPAWRFYPRLFRDVLVKHVRLGRHLWRINRIRRRVAADPNGSRYTDQALQPVSDHEVDSLELFTQTQSARDAVRRARKVAGVNSPTETIADTAA